MRRLPVIEPITKIVFRQWQYHYQSCYHYCAHKHNQWKPFSCPQCIVQQQGRTEHEGQPAAITVDAYPEKEWQGTVESISPGTGSEFSILPAQNATGNWVKVVQRLPVRLELDESDPELPMHTGLSATVKVDTGHRRTLFGMHGPG